jgi:tRNA modification GTPase
MRDPSGFRDTIAALATPHGRGAVALVRISGDRTAAILQRIFRPSSLQNEIASHRASHGRLISSVSGETLDEVVVVFYQSPRSYTGEDMAEIFHHGSPLLGSEILQELENVGARPAQAGEFTLRAFLTGKMDLTQAEAVRDLIDSRTSYQSQLARNQLFGGVSRMLQPVKQELIDLIVRLEATVEFPEEQASVAEEHIRSKLASLIGVLVRMESSFHFSNLVRDGLKMVVAGRPNVGKSSLFNILVGFERAIVNDEPGTTRDLLREQAHLDGIPVWLSDTAGLRTASSTVEALGIEKSNAAMAEADLILLVVDSSAVWEEEDWHFLERAPGQPSIVVLNKSDLPARKSVADFPPTVTPRPVIPVSAKTGDGLDTLRQAIHQAIRSPVVAGAAGNQTLFNRRHQSCIRTAHVELEHCRAATEQNLSEEYLLYHLRQSLQNLDEITGETTPDKLLQRVFATFCIGK